MGSSAKKKREKKKDFQKAKLRVGKTAAKPDNHTNTAFRARSLVLPAQTLVQAGPDSVDQFDRHVALLESKSDSQRKESVTFLTNFVASRAGRGGREESSSTPSSSLSSSSSSPLPRPLSALFPRIQNLILDRSAAVRANLLKLLQALPRQDVRDYCATYKCSPLLLVLTGMAHLSVDVRASSVDVMEWLLDVAGDVVVASPGGWVKPLDHFLGMLRWRWDGSAGAGAGASAAAAVVPSDGSAAAKAKATAALFGKSEAETKLAAKTIRVLAAFLRAGFRDRSDAIVAEAVAAEAFWFPLVGGGWGAPFLAPGLPNVFGPLELFGDGSGGGGGSASTGPPAGSGAKLDQGGGAGSGSGLTGSSAQLLQRAERQRAFVASGALDAVRTGIAVTKPVGGDVGRAVVLVERAVADGMAAFELVC